MRLRGRTNTLLLELERVEARHMNVNRVIRLSSAAKDPSKPWLLRLACMAAVAYLLMPLDFLPDLLPVIGWLDDLLVLSGMLAWVWQSFRARRPALQSSSAHPPH